MSLILWFAILLLPAGPPGAAEPGAHRSTETAGPGESWPSDQLIDRLLSRWADELVADAQFDEEQVTRVRTVIRERWGTFLAVHRDELETVLDGYLELGMDDASSRPEALQAWAEQARPLFPKIRGHAIETMQMVSEALDEKHAAPLARKTQRINDALRAAEARLQDWTTGKFDTLSLHQPSGPADVTPAPSRATGKAASAAGPQADQIQIEMEAWQQHVTSFIARFQLDKGQRDAARSCLEELQERARAHRDRYRVRITELELAITAFTGDPSDQQRIQRELIELYGPIDTMFAELDSRIQKIPTKSQRERVRAQTDRVRKPN